MGGKGKIRIEMLNWYAAWHNGGVKCEGQEVVGCVRVESEKWFLACLGGSSHLDGGAIDTALNQ